MLDIVPKLDLDFSPYSGLYDIIVGKENMYRRLRDEMDWSFVNESMIECYDSDRGRIAINPEFMLKLLVIKTITDLSDADLVEEVKLKGLNPDATYRVTEIDRTDGNDSVVGEYSGDYLMTVGLPLFTLNRLNSRVFTVNKI